MRKKIAWTYRCPICKSKAFHAGEPINGEQVCRCANNLCGHIMTFRAVTEKNELLIANPRYCPVCQSRAQTVTHKIFAPYSYTAYRKFMRCSNTACLSEYTLLVTFGRTLSPSAFGTFDPDAGTVTLTKSPEYHAANPTHITGTENTDVSRSGVSATCDAIASCKVGDSCVGGRFGGRDQFAVRICELDCPTT